MTDNELLASFRHEPNGSWTCIRPVVVIGTACHVGILPGTRFTRNDDGLWGHHIARDLDEAVSRAIH